MCSWMSAARSYMRHVALGERMRAAGVAEVVALGSGCGGLSVGDLVRTGMTGWAKYVAFGVRELTRIILPRGVPVSASLGVLGGTGLTVLFGLERIGRPEREDVVVVTAAAGATGSVAALIAKNVHGCFVVGIAGGEQKCAYLLSELGLDAAVDYKAPGGVYAGLKKALGKLKVDVFFDSIGGETLEAGLSLLAQGGKVVVCGAIGDYIRSGDTLATGPRSYMRLLIQRGRMEGFVIFDFVVEYENGRKRLGKGVVDGKMLGKEVVYNGLDQAGKARLELFEGKNIGKVVIKVADSQFGHGNVKNMSREGSYRDCAMSG